MATKASISHAKYDAANCKGIYLKLNLKTDKDILDKLSATENVQGYIKQLIRKDISGSVPVSMCDAAKEMLQEKADEMGKDPCSLAKLIISEWLIRNP